MLNKTINILMQGVPNIDIDKLRLTIKDINGVKDIHHIHIWYLNENSIHFEAHILMDNQLLEKIEISFAEIKEILHDNYNIEHITLQPECKYCNNPAY